MGDIAAITYTSAKVSVVVGDGVGDVYRLFGCAGHNIYAKKKEWVDGEIYDPVHGKYYKCKMWFSDDKTLQLRGYIGIPALGRTMTWKKL